MNWVVVAIIVVGVLYALRWISEQLWIRQGKDRQERMERSILMHNYRRVRKRK